MPTYDPSRTRRATRGGRDAGCRVYVPAEVLAQAGFGGFARAGSDPPCFKVWASRTRRGGVMIQLYEDGE